MTSFYYINSFFEIEHHESQVGDAFAIRELKKAGNYFEDKAQAIKVLQGILKVVRDANKE